MLVLFKELLMDIVSVWVVGLSLGFNTASVTVTDKRCGLRQPFCKQPLLIYISPICLCIVKVLLNLMTYYLHSLDRYSWDKLAARTFCSGLPLPCSLIVHLNLTQLEVF